MEELNPQMANFEASTRNVQRFRSTSSQALCETSDASSHVMLAICVYRAYTKPLGYAGDYEVVNMMLRDPFEGDSLFAKVINSVFLEF